MPGIDRDLVQLRHNAVNPKGLIPQLARFNHLIVETNIRLYRLRLRAPVPAAMTPSVDLVTQQYQTSTYDVQIYKITTKSGPLHLRSGTGTNYKILGKYKKGREVIVLNKTTSSWYEVTAPDGKRG